MNRKGAEWLLAGIVFATLVYWTWNSTRLGADITLDRQLQVTRESIDEALGRAQLGTPEFSRALRAAGARRLGVSTIMPSPLDTDRRYLANLAKAISKQEKIVIFEPLLDVTNEYPFTVAVINDSGSVECSGIVLDTERVLTLDHCRNIKGVIEEHQVHSASQVIPVKRSNAFAIGGETELSLCILFVEKTLQGPACMRAETKEVDAASAPLTAVGYGLTEITQTTSPGSRGSAVFTVVSNACNGTAATSLPDASEYGCKTGRELVAKADLVKGGTCKGDSGGPLLLKRSDGTLAVAGLTRRAIAGVGKCGRDSLFVRIDNAEARKWIEDTNTPP